MKYTFCIRISDLHAIMHITNITHSACYTVEMYGVPKRTNPMIMDLHNCLWISIIQLWRSIIQLSTIQLWRSIIQSWISIIMVYLWISIIELWISVVELWISIIRELWIFRWVIFLLTHSRYQWIGCVWVKNYPPEIMQPSSSTRATIVSAENQNGATIVKATFLFCHYYIVWGSNNAGEARGQSWNESLKSRWIPGGSCGNTSGTKRKHFAALSSPRPCWRWLQLQPSCGSP